MKKVLEQKGFRKGHTEQSRSNKHLVYSLFAVFFALLSFNVLAQGGSAFFNEIEGFKKEDSLHPPPKNAILFVGSSSFRLWRNLQEYFPRHSIINRGFGGSTLPDVIQYERETIFKYKPKQIIIYCGENDLASSDTITAQTVLQRFQKLFTDIRKVMPNVPIVFVSIKPSPSRWRLKEKLIEANKLIKKFLATKKKTAFADVWPLMLDGDGKPNEALFIEDKLHMNAEGYAIWAKVLDKHLTRNPSSAKK